MDQGHPGSLSVLLLMSCGPRRYALGYRYIGDTSGVTRLAPDPCPVPGCIGCPGPVLSRLVDHLTPSVYNSRLAHGDTAWNRPSHFAPHGSNVLIGPI